MTAIGLLNLFWPWWHCENVLSGKSIRDQRVELIVRIARWMFNQEVFDGIVVGEVCVPWPNGITNEQVVIYGLARAAELEKQLDAASGHLLGFVRLLVPLKPASVRDFVAFEEHVEGIVRTVDASEGVIPEWYEYPTFYFTNPHTLIATDEVVYPPVTERLDFELELAVIVGGGNSVIDVREGGSNLTPAQGADAIFGYAILNDWSARDLQAREMKVRLGPAKGKDFASTVGPWIVTADEFADRHDAEGFLHVEMRALINGEQVGIDNLSNMGWPLGELIAYASRNSRVMPCDILGSGTAGAGCLAELWGRGVDLAALKSGDVVTLEIEGIGSVSNEIGDAPKVPEIPRARNRPRLHRDY